MAKLFARAPTRKMGTLFGTGHLTRAKKEALAAKVELKVDKPAVKIEAPAPRKLSERVAARNRTVS